MNRERVIFNNMLYFLISKAVLELTDILNSDIIATILVKIEKELKLRSTMKFSTFPSDTVFIDIFE